MGGCFEKKLPLIKTFFTQVKVFFYDLDIAWAIKSFVPFEIDWLINKLAISL